MTPRCDSVKTSLPIPTPSTASSIQQHQQHQQNQILNKINNWQTIHSKLQTTLPFVLVTYAQTIDGMIAIRETNQHDEKDKHKDHNTTSNNNVSSNLQLSSQASFQLTHALRSIHDGILIGGNTLLHDNPRLNNRLWPSSLSSLSTTQVDQQQQQQQHQNQNQNQKLKQPIPIILDTNLNHVMNMIESSAQIKAISTHDKIIICCSQDAFKTHGDKIQSSYPCKTIHLLPCKLNDLHIESGGKKKDTKEIELKGGGLNLQHVLQQLYSVHGIESIMVEGGSSILSSFCSQCKKLINGMCVTIVPKFVGGQIGLPALHGCNLVSTNHRSTNGGSDGGTFLKGLEFDADQVSWTTLGCDCIFLASCD